MEEKERVSEKKTEDNGFGTKICHQECGEFPYTGDVSQKMAGEKFGRLTIFGTGGETHVNHDFKGVIQDVP